MLVTGGSRGIGAGIVRALAAEGVRVAFTYVRAADQAQGPGRRHWAGRRAGPGRCKPTRPSPTRRGEPLTRCWRASRSPDILVNNAGVHAVSPIDEAAPDEEALAHLWRSPTAWGVAQTVRAAVPHLPTGGALSLSGRGPISARRLRGSATTPPSSGALAACTRAWARVPGRPPHYGQHYSARPHRNGHGADRPGNGGCRCSSPSRWAGLARRRR
ncbi:MAG: SDR family NAD(P)-dependent oxidoreductase [Hymenobacter sp.]